MSRLAKLLTGQRGSALLARMQSAEANIGRHAALPVAIDLHFMEVVDWAPAHLTPAERLMLFALVCALRPASYLEIGTLQGGSALIVDAALKASDNPALMVLVDPQPRISAAHWSVLSDRATLVQGFSPLALPDAHDCATQPFDLVFIDGDHSVLGVYRDAKGVMSFMSNGAYLLFHDSNYHEVAEGINRFVSEEVTSVLDLGTITREATLEEGLSDIRWGGLRLLRLFR